jgi:hypothetical protein
MIVVLLSREFARSVSAMPLELLSFHVGRRFGKKSCDDWGGGVKSGALVELPYRITVPESKQDWYHASGMPKMQQLEKPSPAVDKECGGFAT